jgi:hypothetical protein
MDNDSLRMEQVITGISDGTFIEVVGNIHEGDRVVTGLNANSGVASTTQNPFMPKMPQRSRTR